MCVQRVGSLIKSNAVKYSFIPPGQFMCCIQGMFLMYPMCPHEHVRYTYVYSRSCIECMHYKLYIIFIVKLGLTSHSRLYICGKGCDKDSFCDIPHCPSHQRSADSY